MKNILSFIAFSLIVACQSGNNLNQEIHLIDRTNFQTELDSNKIDLYTLTNKNGLCMEVTNYGARVVSLWVPDKEGHFSDIVLGYDSISKYLDKEGERFLGATIGRYGNRIAHGRFQLDSVVYQLPANNNGQCLHGGIKGFDRKVWTVDSLRDNKLFFSLLSKDGDEGFPGNLSVWMDYELNDSNQFVITYRAKTDKNTPVNLTHHSFFNLKGEGNGSINHHLLTINADSYTPVDSVLIPFGSIEPVQNTPFDFRTPTAIGSRVNEDNQQLRMGNGYDHNFVINRHSMSDLEFMASVFEPESGRVLEVWSTEPGLQFYGGNFFDGTVKGKNGGTYDYRGSFALETQHFPDSPNQPSFPSTILHPGEEYHQVCVYKFYTKN